MLKDNLFYGGADLGVNVLGNIFFLVKLCACVWRGGGGVCPNMNSVSQFLCLLVSRATLTCQQAPMKWRWSAIRVALTLTPPTLCCWSTMPLPSSRWRGKLSKPGIVCGLICGREPWWLFKACSWYMQCHLPAAALRAQFAHIRVLVYATVDPADNVSSTCHWIRRKNHDCTQWWWEQLDECCWWTCPLIYIASRHWNAWRECVRVCELRKCLWTNTAWAAIFPIWWHR